ncbi:MAG: alanine--tRNA ligase [Chlamydiales bacterium]|nr:alanine--tRNA ligase [Chlamydiales bacterium]
MNHKLHETDRIRQDFLNYFKKNGHAIIPSSPVIPHDDPTLLFINAGMNQFKDVFLGKTVRDYKRAATSQKCIRAGGKHNDLDNVGHTTRHLTFFEMLGNFSFGDYFKEQAIQFAFEVSTEVFQFDASNIYATVFREDNEAFELWKRFLPENRIFRMNEDTNFWAMGDTGPCGPCSELLYDRGSSFGSAKNPIEDTSGERFLEFWNLVFMQNNKTNSGQLEVLPKQSIDTGAGLERVVGLKMGVNSIFATDILRTIIASVENLSGIRYENEHAPLAPAFHVIADHLRSISFAIADGAQPSNVERGYVLRKILRRAVRYGRILKFEEPFLAKVLPTLIDTMADTYKELKQAENRIAEILSQEEEAFFRTLKRGGNLLNQVIVQATEKDHMISGDDAFKLKDTYGLPVEEILLIAKDNHLDVDLSRYQHLEKEAKLRSKATQKTNEVTLSENFFEELANKGTSSSFEGFTNVSLEATVMAILSDKQLVSLANEGDKVSLILDKTPFYAEKGGQVGDTGSIKGSSFSFSVEDCKSPYPQIILHKGLVISGSVKVGDKISAHVDPLRREKIQNNHTATHLLHWALHKVCGEHIKQAGSLVDDARLRFDFNHHKALTLQELQSIEDLVNEKIRSNTRIETYEIGYDEAQKKQEIKQFFGDKYGQLVRVVDIDYSKELCGGTHTNFSGNIGYFRIIKESSIAAGVRRIEAVTGKEAENYAKEQECSLINVANLLKVPSTQVVEKMEKIVEENRELHQSIKAMKQVLLQRAANALLAQQELIDTISFVGASITVAQNELKDLAEIILKELKRGVVLLAVPEENKCLLVMRISSDLVKEGLDANKLVKELGGIIDGIGGGRPDSAQCGGRLPEKLPEVFAFVKKRLKK